MIKCCWKPPLSRTIYFWKLPTLKYIISLRISNSSNIPHWLILNSCQFLQNKALILSQRLHQSPKWLFAFIISNLTNWDIWSHIQVHNQVDFSPLISSCAPVLTTVFKLKKNKTMLFSRTMFPYQDFKESMRPLKYGGC